LATTLKSSAICGAELLDQAIKAGSVKRIERSPWLRLAAIDATAGCEVTHYFARRWVFKPVEHHGWARAVAGSACPGVMRPTNLLPGATS
jgi:hypothetical protein